jgi:hypothetical protein
VYAAHSRLSTVLGLSVGKSRLRSWVAGLPRVLAPPPSLRSLPARRFFGDIRRLHGVTSKAEAYRAKALECEERAEQTRDPFIRQQLIDIAQKWHTMAAYEEKYGR